MAYTQSVSAATPFQLPAIPLSSESLTAGTDIPPPPPSPPPRKSSLPKTPVGISNPLQQHPSTSDFALPLSSHSNTMPGAFPTSPMGSPSPGTPTGLPQMQYSKSRIVSNTLPRDITPQKRPNGIRKFLSLRSLNGSWSNTSNQNNNNTNGNANTTSIDSESQRPASPSTFSYTTSVRPSLNKKRSSMFWGRRKSSLMLDAPDEEGTKNGEERENQAPDRYRSPPPMLPEVEKLTGGVGHGDGGFLGGADMFRDIR
ncbi:hypothetical protein MMC30_000516 [Trapelia coarctata]|nr:hypothetical protein [Trapelia coarctata]